MKRNKSPGGAPPRVLKREQENGRQVELGPLAEGIGFALRRAQLASFKNFQNVFGSAHITPAQYSALLVIELNPGLKQNQVSDALGIKRANFVGLIEELEGRGFVKRSSAVDRRSYALELTGPGKKFIATLHALNAEHEGRLSAGLNPDQRESLMAALEIIVKSVDERPPRQQAEEA